MSCLLFVFIFIIPYSAFAILSMELTRGIAGAIPIAIVPFGTQGDKLPQDVSQIIANDLQNSGRFKVYGRNSLSVFPSDARDISDDYFRRLGTNNVVIGKVEKLDGDRYQLSFQLFDIYVGKTEENALLSRKYTIPSRDLRMVAHHISDLIYQQITGIRGIFSTKLAYVVVQREEGRPQRYTLEICDQDGYNPRPLLDSPEPIMSPAWSPDGKQIAYVSFEERRAGIYIENVATGSRRLVSVFPGINGAPAWSPDGSKLAVVLSKGGSPNIYMMDIKSNVLTQLTNDFYINTEPSWAPDGKSILFTSNRGGGPQIYQLNLATKATSRISFDGEYNARASYTRDGNHIAMIHRVDGIYKIGILNMDTGRMQILTRSAGDSSSPSIAPNSTMLLYDTVSGHRNVLGMVSSDARVQLVLPARNGDAQDPAWSPFLS